MPNPVKGQDYKVRITGVINSGMLRHTVGGSVRFPSVTAVDGIPGAYDVEFDGTDITCPGPLVITETTNDGIVEHVNVNVSGCP